MSTSKNTGYAEMASADFEIRQLNSIRHQTSGHRFQIILLKTSTMRVYGIAPATKWCLQLPDNPEGIVLQFTSSFVGDVYLLDRVFSNGMLPAKYLDFSSVLNGEEQSNVQDISQFIYREYSRLGMTRPSILKSFLRILLACLDQKVELHIRAKQPGNFRFIVQEFLRLLERDYKSRKQVCSYAGELAITSNYLNQAVKETTGRTAGELIRYRIVQEAKRQATYHNLSMKETAYSLGFEDLSHFSRFFKNTAGVSWKIFKNGIDQEFSSNAFMLLND